MFCAVDDCMTNLTGSRQRSFKFPRDPELRRQWTLFCRRADGINYQVERVCQKHFEMEDFERDSRFDGNHTPLKLRLEAMPSVHSHEDIDLGIVEEHLELTAAREKTLLAEYQEEPAKEQPEETDSDYDFEELPAEGCMQVQVVDADAYLKVLERENTELKRDNFKMNLSIQTSERDMERLQRQLDNSNERYGQLVGNLEQIFSTAQIEKIQNDRRIVWPRTDLIEAHSLYAASRSVYNMLLSKNYPLPSVRTMQYWEARERKATTTGSMQTGQLGDSAAPVSTMHNLFEVIDATNTDHNYT
ncbi:52 kDa repressor of the inhibitor of the protein kinase-like [Drosophila obscura]|uniref:52 kDa repressor of the inhibitor of the protein kinase-like n=1 Tax=Drosophila obscura TaxID=7282 RepID=UPI001BB18C7C|nr:52 kDa repressor of the inhibitor of the protein kinase-like [Drosophila obscura]